MLLRFTLITFCVVLLYARTADAQIRIRDGKQVSPLELDAFIKRQMDSLAIPGVSIAVFNHTGVVYHRLLGVKSLTTHASLDDQDMFDAGSLTKSVFAYFVLKMVDQALISLDTPLYRYLPHPDIQYDDRYKGITARMVLSHSSGFPNWRRFNTDKRLDIKFTPGTDFLYSGEGYEYLADVLAHRLHIEKDSLAVTIQKTIFQPLHMQTSATVWNDVVAAHRIDGHVDGKVSEGWGISKKSPGFYASYSLQTEAADYARFLVALMNGQGLSPEHARQMMDIQIKSAKDGRSWGLGIEIEELPNGKRLYKHGGFNKNFSCGYLFSKDTRTGFVFFANNDTGYPLNNILKQYFTN